jgi:hypothetical protein
MVSTLAGFCKLYAESFEMSGQVQRRALALETPPPKW